MNDFPNIDIDDYDIKCQNLCGVCFSWKRFFLPISFILPILIYQNKFQTDVYIFFSLFFSSWIICWNIPLISKLGYTKPAYFEDLNISNNILQKRKILSNIEQSKKFQNIFINIQQFVLSLTIAVIIDYGIKKYKFKELSITEILTVIGALLSLYSKISKFIGKILLIILFKIKQKNDSLKIDLNTKNNLKKIIENNKLKKCISHESLKKLEKKYLQ